MHTQSLFQSFLSAKSRTKAPVPRLPGLTHPDWEGGSIVETSSQQENGPKLVSTTKIRIEVGTQEEKENNMPSTRAMVQTKQSPGQSPTIGKSDVNTSEKPPISGRLPQKAQQDTISPSLLYTSDAADE